MDLKLGWLMSTPRSTLNCHREAASQTGAQKLVMWLRKLCSYVCGSRLTQMSTTADGHEHPERAKRVKWMVDESSNPNGPGKQAMWLSRNPSSRYLLLYHHGRSGGIRGWRVADGQKRQPGLGPLRAGLAISRRSLQDNEHIQWKPAKFGLLVFSSIQLHIKKRASTYLKNSEFVHFARTSWNHAF